MGLRSNTVYPAGQLRYSSVVGSDQAGSLVPGYLDQKRRWSLFCRYARKSLVPNLLKTLCVVDDDSSVFKPLRRLLSSAGLRMTGFSDPRLFLEHAKEHKVALVIIDVWMPELRGLEVQRLLQTIAPSTPVIIPA